MNRGTQAGIRLKAKAAGGIPRRLLIYPAVRLLQFF